MSRQPDFVTFDSAIKGVGMSGVGSCGGRRNRGAVQRKKLSRRLNESFVGVFGRAPLKIERRRNRQVPRNELAVATVRL